MINTDELPDGWARPDESSLAHAREMARAALRDGGEHPVSERLAAYYKLDGNYAGASFAELQPTEPTDITSADLHAAALLSIEVGSRTTRRLLNDGGYRMDALSALLKIEPTDELSDAGAGLLTDMAEFYLAIKRACSDPTANNSNPWVTASKFCARKRPGLFPVRDHNVCELLGLIGRGRPRGNYEIDWLVFRDLRSRPRFGVNDHGPGSWWEMLGDGSDGFRCRLGVDLGAVELGWRVEQLAAQVGEQPGAGGGHGHAAPAA
jgi:hypothetical protein